MTLANRRMLAGDAFINPRALVHHKSTGPLPHGKTIFRWYYNITARGCHRSLYHIWSLGTEGSITSPQTCDKINFCISGR